MPKQINIQELQPGMVIVRITEQNGPIKIRKSGLVTSREMVQGLIEMGIQQVEIDPDQTVEVQAQKVKTPVAGKKSATLKKSAALKKSATLRMLESNNATDSRNEDGVSEQYHRNLFLPSVQDIPSAWQFYIKRYLLAAYIAIGGLCLGWSLANYQLVMNLLSKQFETAVTSVPAPAAVIESQNTMPVKDEAIPQVQIEKLQEITTNLVTTSDEQLAAQPDEDGQISEPVEVELITPVSVEPTELISADVLARFEKAMTEVEDLPVTQQVAERQSNSKDVPRIDQLPAWVLTRLPNMAFSAHMYASEGAERWVRVNGTQMFEGDKIDGIIEIISIEPQHVILNYSGQTFSMAALTDW